jgi:hypothetical protein
VDVVDTIVIERTSRAVLRIIEAGNDAECVTCQSPIKFRVRAREQQVICNVYVDGRWDRVEHHHEACYESAGAPYGDPAPPMRRHPAA